MSNSATSYTGVFAWPLHSQTGLRPAAFPFSNSIHKLGRYVTSQSERSSQYEKNRPSRDRYKRVFCGTVAVGVAKKQKI